MFDQAKEFTIRNLPDLSLIEIFKHLGLIDLTRMRLVSRRWMYLIDQQRIEELVISNEEYQCEQSWFFINKKIKLDQVLKLDVLESDFQLFNRKIIQLRLLRMLRRLRIRKFQASENRYTDWADDLICRLAKFVKLEQLEIEFALTEFGCKLVHPNLKLLHVNVWTGGDQIIEIDCPRLQTLSCQADFEQFIIVHPETIKLLYNVRFCRNTIDPDYAGLKMFTNLESFVSHDLRCTNGNILRSSPKLKELRAEGELTIRKGLGFGNEQAVANLLELIEKKEYLGRDGLKIFFNDRECSSVAQLKENHSDLFECSEFESDYDPCFASESNPEQDSF